VQSDPIGLAGGVSTFAYANNRALSRIDPLGLSDSDVQGVWRDVLRSFTELRPDAKEIGYANMAKSGETSPFLGLITIPHRWKESACFDVNEYAELFFILFHEGMHSTDPWWVRANPFNIPDESPYHKSVYNREGFERARADFTPGRIKPR
jgi:hypothetical protein